MTITNGQTDERGFALEATLMVMLLLSVVIAAAALGAATVVRTSSYDYRNSRVFYAAEGAAEGIMAQLHDALQDGYLDSTELDDIAPDDIPGFEVAEFRVNKVGNVVQESITDGPFAGLYSLTQRVEIFAEARDAIESSSALMVSVKAQAIPIIQFGIFYEKDLEATNGPSMEFAGWVHSNGNIYLSSDNAWYRDVITTPNNVFHDRKDNHNVKNGVFINDASANEVKLDFDSRTHPGADAFRSESDAKFDNRLKTDAYAVDSLRVPLPEGMDAVEVLRPREGDDTELERRAKFSWKADWYIEIPMNLVTAGVGLCNAMVHTRAPGKAAPSTAECNNIFVGGWETFYEGREQRFVDALDLDVDQLRTWVAGDPAGRSTFVLYVTFTGAPVAGPADPSGDGFYPILRITNGQLLPNAMTVATDYPLYVRGDYNSLSWDPAALIGDAITILSNGWSDTDHQAPVIIKTDATNTQVFAAILAGHSGTPCDHEDAGCPGGYTDFYGGGIENFPRFLEKWSGTTLTYRGSLVSLHWSQRAVGTWNGNYYSPPVRDWQFDTRFEDPQNLPPGTPVVGQIIRTAFRPMY